MIKVIFKESKLVLFFAVRYLDLKFHQIWSGFARNDIMKDGIIMVRPFQSPRTGERLGVVAILSPWSFL